MNRRQGGFRFAGSESSGAGLVCVLFKIFLNILKINKKYNNIIFGIKFYKNLREYSFEKF